MQQSGIISDDTLLEEFGIDPDKESERIVQAEIKKAETAVKLKAKVNRAEFMANRDELSDSEDDDGFDDYRNEVIDTARKLLEEPDERKRTHMLMEIQKENEGKYRHVLQVMAEYMGEDHTQGYESTEEGGSAPAGTAAANEAAEKAKENK